MRGPFVFAFSFPAFPCASGPILVSLWQGKRQIRIARRYKNVLLAVYLITDGIRSRRMPHEKLPQRLSGRSIQREEIGLIRSAEHQSSRGGKNRHPRRRQHLELPLPLAGGSDQRPNRAIGLLP